MVKPETLQELRTLVLESEGITSEDEKCFICNMQHDGYEFTEKTEVHKSEKEPITGERALKALGKLYYDYILFDSENNLILIGDRGDCDCSCSLEMMTHHKINWTLCQPAKEQSEEDIQKIIKLLK